MNSNNIFKFMTSAVKLQEVKEEEERLRKLREEEEKKRLAEAALKAA